MQPAPPRPGTPPVRVAGVLLIVTVALLVAGCAAIGAVGRDPGGANAQAGDCVILEPGPGNGTLARELDCAAPDAVYQVGYREDGRTSGACSNEFYDQYSQTGPDGDFVLCLMMNGVKGDCFTGYAGGDQPKAKVDCSVGEVTVSERLDGRTDPSACPPTAGWRLLYPQPGRTVCLDAIKAGIRPPGTGR